MPNTETNFDVSIEKLIYGGDGLARSEGRVVLVPFALPGETVTVRPARPRGDVLHAALLEVKTAAAGRVEPPCPYFARCGGCHYQHLNYQDQIAAKRSILAETLRRVGKIDPPEAISILAAEPWEYRNRAQFHVKDGAIGYRAAGSHWLVPVDRCPISSPRVNETLTTLAGMIRHPRWPRFVRSVEVFTNESEVQINVLESDQPVARRFFDWCAHRIPGAASPFLDYTVGDHTYRVSNRSFFQVNRFLAGALAAAALEGEAGSEALDLYAGVGLFALPLAAKFASVTAVESNAGAVRDLKLNAERAGATVTAVAQSSEDYLAGLERAPDFVLADPPRAGLGRKVVERLAALKPARVTIVSCDPATLARDLGGLLAAGYRLGGLTMVDLFPQTYHIEAIARLEWAG